MDAMTHLTLKLTGLPRNRVIGMGGLLDSSRFKYFLSQALQCNHNDVHGIVIGGHGDKTMIPLSRFATYKGIPVSHLLPDEKIEEVVKNTMVGGATLTKLLGTSAWIAPGASISHLVESIVKDQKKLIDERDELIKEQDDNIIFLQNKIESLNESINNLQNDINSYQNETYLLKDKNNKYDNDINIKNNELIKLRKK